MNLTARRIQIACVVFILSALRILADEVRLSSIDNVRVFGAYADAEHARPTLDTNALGQAMRVGGREYAQGLGLQVECRVGFDLRGATHFSALAGVDDASEKSNSVRLAVTADGRSLWSAELKKGGAPVAIDLDLRGCSRLTISTVDLGNSDSRVLVDLADARFMVNGEQPKVSRPEPIIEAREILTPLASSAPRINSARVFGVRPGHPFLFTLAATGERPMTFTAENLPAGLALDGITGRITGQLDTPATHWVTVRARNSIGQAESSFRIQVGEDIALTPPMGWNSWNCWGVEVDAEKVLASARAMVTSGLIDHGWTYVNIDDTWQGERAGPDYALAPNRKFPDLRKLADEVHGLGLKIGIYSTPWDTSYCGQAGGSSDNKIGLWSKALVRDAAGRRRWHHGAFSFAEADARQWAAWGFDYLKYDWNPKDSSPPENSAAFHQHIVEMAQALRTSGRDLIYSYSNTFPFEDIADNAGALNAWRTTGDITDMWGRVVQIGFSQGKWSAFTRPGHWNDPDMLVVGEVDVGRGEKLHLSHLTPAEQYTHISLWCLLSAPLLIGCPLERLDAFTLSLLSNDEVLQIDQDERGIPAQQVLVEGRKQIWVKPLADGSQAIGLFNLAQEPQEVSATWDALHVSVPGRMRDLWRQRDIPISAKEITAIVPRHGVLLLRVWPGIK